jgi:hypothetical protein
MWDPRPRLGDDGEPVADSPTDTSSVLVELAGSSAEEAMQLGRSLASAGFRLDAEYDAVPMHGEQTTFVLRGEIDGGRIADLEGQPAVVRVWRDTPIAPFDTRS